MHRSTSSGTLNRNQGSEAQTRLDAGASSGRVERTVEDLAPLGAKSASTTGLRVEAPSTNTRRNSLSGQSVAGSVILVGSVGTKRGGNGGQYAISLFGCTGATGNKTATEGQTSARLPHRSRIKGALNSFDTDGLTPAHFRPQATQPAPVAPAAPTPIRLTLAREPMAVFATVASHEARPLEDVLAEALSEQAARWTRTRHTLHLHPRDQALLDDYLDSLSVGDTLERMEEEAAYRALTTPQMQAAARAADEREAFVPEHDLEEWDRSLPFGHVEIALACD